MELVEITDEYIQNHSDRSLWFTVNDTVCVVNPNERKEESEFV